MHVLASDVAAAVLAALLTYEVAALAVSFAALVIACYALARVEQSDRRQDEREQALKQRADELGEAITDDLAED